MPMKKNVLLLVGMAIAGCASGPRMKDLDCDSSYGNCSASLEPEGYEWFAKADSECGIVTVDGRQRPFCGYKASLGTSGTYEIQSCKACVLRGRK